MTEVPKIVYDRLRAARPEHALPEHALLKATGPQLEHPDANLLAAFAEQVLSASERDCVLAHLALCLDCRDVIALALPAADIVALPMPAEAEAVPAALPTKPDRNWLIARNFAWPSLRWAALAAGIAVVAGVFLLRPGKLNQAMPPSENPQIATTAQPASGSQAASSAAPWSPIASSPTNQPTNQSAASAKTEELHAKSESRLSRRLKAAPVVTPSHQSERGMLLAENKKDSGQVDKLSPTAEPPAFDAPTSRVVTETVEVAGAGVTVETAPAADASLMATNQTRAIEKAKPAPPGMEVPGMEVNEQQKARAFVVPAPTMEQGRNVMSTAKLAAPASPALARNVTWTITAGTLQRSLDSGQSWQNTLQSDRPLLCYASHDNDVWTGGQAGTLFHSADSGVTWVRVQPSIKGHQLSSDITHVELRGDARGLAEILISTNNNEIWSSADNGRTWNRK
jgi:hypothetical protein